MGRRAAIGAVLVLLCALLAGCGGCGDEDGGGPVAAAPHPTPAATPPREPLTGRGEALAYFPPDAALVALVSSDVEDPQYRAVDDLVDLLPLDDELRTLPEEVGRLLGRGRPLAIGVPSPAPEQDALRALRDGARPLLAAAVARDARTLEARVRARETRDLGGYRGARLSELSSVAVAVRGRTLLAARDETTLRTALTRRDSGRILPEQAVDRALDELAPGAAVQLVADRRVTLDALAALGPVGELAGRGAWGRSLDRAGLTLRAEPGRIDAALHLPSAAVLKPEDRPLPDALGPPRLAETEGVALGLEDPAHLLRYLERSGGRRLGLDRDVLDQLDGDASAVLDGDARMLRIDVADPRGLADALGELAPALPRLLGDAGLPGARLTREDGMLRIERDGDRLADLAVVGDALVIGDAEPDRLRELAEAEPEPADDADGPAALRVDERWLRDRLGVPDVARRLMPIGDTSGWLRGEPAGVVGHLTIETG